MDDPNREFLLQLVEQQESLDGRFSRIRLIGSIGGYGHFSLMFSAIDGLTGRRVALKVYHHRRPGQAAPTLPGISGLTAH